MEFLKALATDFIPDRPLTVPGLHKNTTKITHDILEAISQTSARLETKGQQTTMRDSNKDHLNVSLDIL